MDTERTIVEINGVKMEVDLRHARIVHENIRVGSKVKLLSKSDYQGPQVYAGVVVGFEPFDSLPTIIVAYVKDGYNDSGLYFAHVNAKSAEKYDIVPSLDDELPVKKEDVLAQFDRKIDKARAELETAVSQRDYFLRHFNRYFAQATA
jgi:hypothetical protein